MTDLPDPTAPLPANDPYREHAAPGGSLISVFRHGPSSTVTTVQVSNADGIIVWAKTSATEAPALRRYARKIAEYDPAAATAGVPAPSGAYVPTSAWMHRCGAVRRAVSPLSSVVCATCGYVSDWDRLYRWEPEVSS